MTLEGDSFDISISKVKFDLSVNDNEENQHVTEETNYSDLLDLCDEISFEVPDTEINLRCQESINDIWDCPQPNKCRRKTTSSKIRKLLDVGIGNRLKPFDTLTLDNEKNFFLTKSKLIRPNKRKHSHTSLDISATESLPLSPQQLPQTPILNVPPNSPFDAKKPDSSYDNPFVICLLKILEQTRMDNLSNHTETSPLASSERMLSSVPTSFCTSEIITIPDVGSPHCPVQRQQPSQSDDDHVVPHLNEQLEAHSSNMFYDSDVSFLYHHRVMQSCIDRDHIVPDIIEE